MASPDPPSGSLPPTPNYILGLTKLPSHAGPHASTAPRTGKPRAALPHVRGGARPAGAEGRGGSGAPGSPGEGKAARSGLSPPLTCPPLSAGSAEPGPPDAGTVPARRVGSAARRSPCPPGAPHRRCPGAFPIAKCETTGTPPPPPPHKRTGADSSTGTFPPPPPPQIGIFTSSCLQTSPPPPQPRRRTGRPFSPRRRLPATPARAPLPRAVTFGRAAALPSPRRGEGSPAAAPSQWDPAAAALPHGSYSRSGALTFLPRRGAAAYPVRAASPHTVASPCCSPGKGSPVGGVEARKVSRTLSRSPWVPESRLVPARAVRGRAVKTPAAAAALPDIAARLRGGSRRAAAPRPLRRTPPALPPRCPQHAPPHRGARDPPRRFSPRPQPDPPAPGFPPSRKGIPASLEPTGGSQPSSVLTPPPTGLVPRRSRRRGSRAAGPVLPPPRRRRRIEPFSPPLRVWIRGAIGPHLHHKVARFPSPGLQTPDHMCAPTAAEGSALLLLLLLPPPPPPRSRARMRSQKRLLR
ncbi:nascent polypeptide-associated complex subunit alpha, muscle-specific form-like [Nyctibius grandis]|uniref:nascent polypeptide-associated complex subunit alpha, muscle-specific form-like n=1 Tax=Nyctibius grandis TaxID=48427 RepID=UPI0035BBDA1A